MPYPQTSGKGQPGLATKLTVGTVTEGSSPAVTITGTPPEQTLNFVLKGGNAGPANVLTIGTVTALSPGSSPTVSVTGTAPNQVLNFGLATAANGVTPTFSIGAVTTGAAGSSASVTITGTPPAYVLNFTIPKGANGLTPTFIIGTVTTLAPGAAATAAFSGTAPNYVLNLGIPAGASGAAMALSIGTVSTLAAGASATASITGTAPNYVLNVGIPAGVAGVSYNPQAPVSRTVTVATAYQHTDTTKPYKVQVNARATQTVTLAGTVADRVELRIGPTAASVAPGGSGGFSVGVWESGITGIAVMIGAAVQDGGQVTADVPTGWYFQVNRVAGTSATIVSCFTQAVTA